MSLENESKWVINGIMTVALVTLLVPALSGTVEKLDAVVLVAIITYIVYTAMSGEAIDPPDRIRK